MNVAVLSDWRHTLEGLAIVMACLLLFSLFSLTGVIVSPLVEWRFGDAMSNSRCVVARKGSSVLFFLFIVSTLLPFPLCLVLMGSYAH